MAGRYKLISSWRLCVCSCIFVVKHCSCERSFAVCVGVVVRASIWQNIALDRIFDPKINYYYNRLQNFNDYTLCVLYAKSSTTTLPLPRLKNHTMVYVLCLFCHAIQMLLIINPNSLNFTFGIIISFVFNVKTSMANDVKWFMFPSFIWWLRQTDWKHRRLLDGDYTLIIAHVYSFDASHLFLALALRQVYDIPSVAVCTYKYVSYNIELLL